MPNPKKTKSTIMVDAELWKRLRLITVLNDMEISEFVEEALREKLEKIQQPEQYQAYKDVENIRLPAGKQSQQLQQQKPSDIFNKDNVIPLKKGESAIRLHIPGLKFPVNREGLIQYINETKKTDILTVEMVFAEHLPRIKDKMYKDKFELEGQFQKYIRDNKEAFTLRGEDGLPTDHITVSCIIDIRTDKQKDIDNIRKKQTSLAK
jgi:hypothetical protein